MQSLLNWFSLFLHNPRKSWLRRSLFQMHLWTGIAVGILSTIVGISGSAIVYKDALEQRLTPRLFHTTPGKRMNADRLVERARERHPSWSIQYVSIEQAEDLPEPWVFYMAPALAKPSEQKLIYIDPSSGKMLGEVGRTQGLMNWIAELHYRLLAGQTGTIVNGIGAILLLLLCLTGIVIWWPGKSRWRSGLHIHWRARWPRLNWDLHNVLGFWLAAPLAIEAFTGIYYCFFLPMAGALVLLMGGNPHDIQKILVPPRSIARQGAQSYPLELLIQESLRRHPDCALRGLMIPEKPTDPVVVSLNPPHAEDRGQYARVAFDRYTGAMLSDIDSRHESSAIRTLLFLGPLHFGTFAGHYSRIAWIVLGLSPGLLFFTGFLMWWRRVVSKKIKQYRKAVETAEAIAQ